MGSLRDDLQRNEAYPDGLAFDITLIETHISWVFLRGDEAWKVKKPLDLGFLDFRTLEQRRLACEAELRLNRRLAPDIYREVRAIRQDESGQHHLGTEGKIVDYAVLMTRLSDDQRADQLLALGKLDEGAVVKIANKIARFHEDARADEYAASFGDTKVIGFGVRENFEQTREVIGNYLKPPQARAIEAWQLEFLARPELFEARIRARKIREGHGDLRLEHLYFRDDGSLTIIDCIEFNERFRYADNAADLAFLSMDLSWHGRVDLAELLLSSYAREAGDYELYQVVDFYQSYRAYVRAKVSTLLAHDPKAAPARRRQAAEDARRYFLLALASQEPCLLEPRLIAVGGVIASGKSTVARRVGHLLTSPVIDADTTRKQLLGMAPTRPMDEPIWQGAYRPEFTEEVYAELMRRAKIVLQSGRSVVLDASFRAAHLRKMALELARDLEIPFSFIECQAPREVCRERLRTRERGASDGRLAIFDDFCAKWEQVNEFSPDEHLVLDTTLPSPHQLSLVEARLPSWRRVQASS